MYYTGFHNSMTRNKNNQTAVHSCVHILGENKVRDDQGGQVSTSALALLNADPEIQMKQEIAKRSEGIGWENWLCC